VGGVWIFSGETHSQKLTALLLNTNFHLNSCSTLPDFGSKNEKSNAEIKRWRLSEKGSCNPINFNEPGIDLTCKYSSRLS